MSQMIESFMNDSATGVPRAQPIALDEMVRGAGAGPALVGTAHPLHAVKVKLSVCVGQAALTLGDLLGARENEVLPLDRAVDQPVDLVLEGKVVARGQLVAVDGCFAVRVTELPLPLKF
ncbi:FliM/FliN family flagellar motor switch protein [Ramlibacter pallidus]|uniref:Flagellar motor switch protein FliN n=1 Tax=Ramlibacter pallidus TaxID=2780087 RepID=A0ABR9S141_9BURK|nr:FliM/FliN family flagellar motor C-terminal domain-containing protein [Ramlibacter pallidus]MBE7367185.1 FliM/FliN family flagellar motor switch protein [Ramlibacter pallidus]